MAVDIVKKLPDDIDYMYTYNSVKHDMTPLNVVLLQEIIRYNKLLHEIRKSLENLQNGIKGIIVMNLELEEAFQYIFEGYFFFFQNSFMYARRVPPIWSKAYFNLKPLASWNRDLIQRIEFFSEWAKGYFFSPK